MKTHFFKLLVITLIITSVSCKKENTFTDYKYSDKPATIACDGLNAKLYQEALYSFEDDILNYYKKANAKASIATAYSQLMRNAIYGKIKYEDIISAHSIKVFEALKNEKDLWDANNPKSHLNYNSATVKCISNNMKDQALKTTFDALISTNSMSPKLFGAPLMAKYRTALSDKHLTTYVALDLFYAKFFDVDLSKAGIEEVDLSEQFNVIKEGAETEADPHAGHNH